MVLDPYSYMLSHPSREKVFVPHLESGLAWYLVWAIILQQKSHCISSKTRSKEFWQSTFFAFLGCRYHIKKF